MFEMIREFIMFTCISGSITLMVVSIGKDWAEDNYEECGVEF